MKKRYFTVPIICLLVSLCAAWVMKRCGCCSELGLCRDLTVTSDDRIYGIDYSADRRKYMIFGCDMNGSELETIPLSSVNKDRRRVYDYLIVDRARGDVYVHVSEYGRTSGLLENEEICLCDFQKRGTKKAWELPANIGSTASTARAAYIYDGALFYLSDENGVEVYSCGADGNFSLLRSIEGGSGISEYGFFDGATVAAFGTTSGLYVETGGELVRMTTEGSPFVNCAWGNDSAGATDLNNGISYLYRDEAGALEAFVFAESFEGLPDGRGIESVCEVRADMLSSICLFDGGFAAYSEMPAKLDERGDKNGLRSCLAVYENKTLRLYKSLRFSGEYLDERFKKTALMFFLVSSAAYAVIELIAAFFKKRGYISLSAETVLLAAAVFGTAVSFTGFEISGIMTRSFDESYDKVFDDLEAQMSAELDLMLAGGERDVFSDEFRSELSEIMRNTLVTDLQNGEKEFAPYFVLHVLDEKGRLIMLYNSSGKEMIPTSYVYSNRYTGGVYADVLAHGCGTNITQYDTEGVWNVKLCYYENAAANVRAVIEIGIDRYMTDRKTELITVKIVGYILFLCCFFILTVIFFIALSFAPVRRLTKQMTGHDVEKPENNRGCFELDRIREQLYVMTKSVRERLESIETNNAQHYRFVSRKLITLLGADGIESASLGTSHGFYGVFAELVFEDRGSEKLNELYEWAFPIIDSLGGVIYEIGYCRVSVLFSREDLRDCRECLEKISLKSDERFNIRAAAGIGLGEGLICVVGTDDSAYAAVISDERDRAENAARGAFDRGIAVGTTENVRVKLSEGRK